MSVNKNKNISNKSEVVRVVQPRVVEKIVVRPRVRKIQAAVSTVPGTNAARNRRRRQKQRARGAVVSSSSELLAERLAYIGNPRGAIDGTMSAQETRFPDEFNTEPTSVVTVFDDIDVPAYAGDEFNLFIFKIPLCAYILSLDVSDATSYATKPRRNLPDDGNWGHLMYQVGTEIHGGVQYPGKSDDDFYYWFNAGDVVTLTGAASDQATSLYVRHYSSDEQTIEVWPAGAPQFLINMPVSGYFSIGHVYAQNVDSPINVTLSVVTKAGNSVYGIRTLPGLDKLLTVINQVRVNVAACTYTNDASPLNRQGKYTFCQIPGSEDWFDYGRFNSVSKLAKAFTSKIDNGAHFFIKPSGLDDGRYTGVGSETNHHYNLDDTKDFLAFKTVINNVPGHDAVLRITFGLETKHNNQYMPVGSPPVDIRMIDITRAAIHMPQIMDNPVHMREILQWTRNAAKNVVAGIKSGTNFVVDNAPKVVAGAKIAAKLMAVLGL